MFNSKNTEHKEEKQQQQQILQRQKNFYEK